MAQPSTRARIGNFVHVAVFVGLLWLPLAAALFRLEHRDVLAENRALAPLPRLGTDKIASLAGKFDKYYNDHFGLRNTLIWTHDLLKVRYLGGEANSKEVVEGKDGWLFYCGLGAEENHQGLRPFTPRQLEAWQDVLEGKRRWLAQRGIEYLFVVAPDKESIYPEYLPAYLQRPGATTQLDQLVEYLRKHSDVEIVDLRPALRAARHSGDVYYAHDTHWNDRGALAGYREICARLQRYFPELKPYASQDFRHVRAERAGDLCALAGLHDLRQPCERLLAGSAFKVKPVALELGREYPWPKFADWQKPLAFERPDRRGRLLLFHDSFLGEYRRYLAEHFGRSVCLSMQPDFAVLNLMVQRERPNVVVEEWVERYLAEPPPSHPLWTAARNAAAPTRR